MQPHLFLAREEYFDDSLSNSPFDFLFLWNSTEIRMIAIELFLKSW